jgi:MraZ protein
MERQNTTMGEAALASISNAFVNTYKHSLDAKKRLTIPSEWRSLVGSPERLFVLPSSIEPCLNVYPARELARRMQKVDSMSEVDVEAQNNIRELSMNANFLPWDAQGRIRIDDHLLNFAKLESEVVLVGVLARFEIWSPEIWKQKQSTSINQQKILAAARSVGL